MRKILVTGATGFIGQYVVDRLLSEGHTVIATSAHEEHARPLPWFDRVRYIPFDLANFDPAVDYYRFFNEPDAIIHLAWEGLPQYKAAFHLDINYPRHAALLDNLVRHGLRDITVTGTCLEYGLQEGCLREDMPVFPDNAYAIAKNELRKFLQDLESRFPVVVKWARLFYLYGKGQNPGSLYSLLRKALENGDKVFNMSGGEQMRDFLPVEKAASYIVQLALQLNIRGIVNICSGQPVTVKQFVVNYLALMNSKITLNLGYYPYADYEPMRFWGDDSKLKTLI